MFLNILSACIPEGEGQQPVGEAEDRNKGEAEGVLQPKQGEAGGRRKEKRKSRQEKQKKQRKEANQQNNKQRNEAPAKKQREKKPTTTTTPPPRLIRSLLLFSHRPACASAPRLKGQNTQGLSRKNMIVCKINSKMQGNLPRCQ